MTVYTGLIVHVVIACVVLLLLVGVGVPFLRENVIGVISRAAGKRVRV
jgi:hypothetical protein